MNVFQRVIKICLHTYKIIYLFKAMSLAYKFENGSKR